MGDVGGLVGYNIGTSTITTSYSVGAVSGSGSTVGGLAGHNTGTLTASFWDQTSSGQNASAGGMGLTTAQMQTAADLAGFSFTSTPGASGNNWVLVDLNGTLNNAGGAQGATFPMLASEYTTRIDNAHQLQLMAMNLGGNRMTWLDQNDRRLEPRGAARMCGAVPGSFRSETQPRPSPARSMGLDLA